MVCNILINNRVNVFVKWINIVKSDESTNGGGEHPGKDRDPGYLPYEMNRFKFQQTDLYYNASNVTLDDESWLLAQSPLPGQLSEFWTMIWESERTGTRIVELVSSVPIKGPSH